MDVAFVNRMLGMTRGGGEIQDLGIARSLSEMGIDIEFYVGKPLTGPLSNPLSEFDSVTVPSPHLRNLAYAAPPGIGGAIADVDAVLFGRRVASRLRGKEYDVVYVNGDPRFGYYLRSVPTPMVIKMNGAPHSFWHDTINPLSSSYDFLDYLDAVVSVSGAVADLKAHVDKHIYTVNAGVDPERFTPGDRGSDETFRLLYVGRFVPIKNLGFLLKAFAEFNDRHPDTELTLVGDGPLRGRLESKADTLGIADAVEFVGYVDYDALPEQYRRADLLVLSSETESFGNVVVEAMSCGLPVVVPNVGHLPTLVDDGSGGIVYQSGSKDGFLEAMERLFEDESLREHLGREGRGRVLSEHTWEQRATEMKRIFESLH